MVYIPKRVSDRLIKEVKKYQKILKNARDKDVNESDTVMIVNDILTYVFGFDKFSELTSELKIRSQYCDVAVKIGGSIKFLIEVKAVGESLKGSHLDQVLDYGAKEGIEWIVLTNGILWKVYKVKFEKPVSADPVCSIKFLDINPRNKEDQEQLFIICREGIKKSAIEEFYRYKAVVNRFMIGAILLGGKSRRVIKSELRRISPRLRIDELEIEDLLKQEVIKRDITEGKDADQAAKIYKKSQKTRLRPRRKQRIPLENRTLGARLGQ